MLPGVMAAVGFPPPFARNQCYEDGSNGIAQAYNAIIPCPEEYVNVLSDLSHSRQGAVALSSVFPIRVPSGREQLVWFICTHCEQYQYCWTQSTRIPLFDDTAVAAQQPVRAD
jgi:hypothetical protein